MWTEIPGIYSIHFIKYASDVTCVDLGQLSIATTHFTLAGNSSNWGKYTFRCSQIRSSILSTEKWLLKYSEQNTSIQVDHQKNHRELQLTYDILS